MTRLTSEAKSLLSSTIRGLRERLLRDLYEAVEGEYRIRVTPDQARLTEAGRVRRARLEAWRDERVRASQPKDANARDAAKARFLLKAVKEAAYTLLNRMVVLRHLEALDLASPPVLTGGWKSKGYLEFRDFAPGLVGDATEGYEFLLRILFDEWAQALPGLFGDVGVTRLIPIPASTLREVVERLDDPRLASAWGDDTTLGWIYQYWNDPEREALDAKINGGGKIEPHEIASKTQMFTERYMVEWLLHNSLGVQWLCICKKNGWRPDAEDVLDPLDARRAEWRVLRERGEVALDELMPIHGDLEDHWKYYVPQPIPDDAVAAAPDSIRDLKLLDPACGSGHFLVIAFDLLAAMYREEARHRGLKWSDREIAEWILERNLHGVDIDPRAVQIAAAALFLKMKSLDRDARLKSMNLVAPALHLGSLPSDDPALIELRREVEVETGIPGALTDNLVRALAGADHLGTLLKVDAAVAEVIREHDANLLREGSGQLLMGLTETKASLLDRLEQFLGSHSAEAELGVRLDGEELAAGVRFIRIVKESQYDCVIGNPPYHGTSRLVDPNYVVHHYPLGKAELYAAFLERGLQLAKARGRVSFVTMLGWMFVGQFSELRRWIVEHHSIRVLADLRWSAFENNRHCTAVMYSVQKGSCPDAASVGLATTSFDERDETNEAISRKRAALLAQNGRYEFDPGGCQAVVGVPILYWWSPAFLAQYRGTPKLGEVCAVRKGICTCNDARFTRMAWEPQWGTTFVERAQEVDLRPASCAEFTWAPTVMGGEGREWQEPLLDLVLWRMNGVEIKVAVEHQYGVVSKRVQSVDKYFVPGIAFTMIGSGFAARAHRYRSVFGDMGSSVFPQGLARLLCLMNSATSRFVLESLNPGIHFQVGDVNRLPVLPVDGAHQIFRNVDNAFTEHESCREPSVEFRRPGPSPWRYAQAWAQRAVDRQAGEALQPYEPEYDSPQPVAFVSFALGFSLGRFGANGEGLLARELADALPAGILYLSSATGQDSLDDPACAGLHAAWAEHGPAIAPKDDLRTYLRASFFAFHRTMYENRPIHLPLSSAKKNFVAWTSIHRWNDATLPTLLADHLRPDVRRLDGELEDLRKTRAAGYQAKVEKRYVEVQRLHEELSAFIDAVTACAEKGPPPPDAATPKREVDARFSMDLDDGVMVNSAALWPLLEPQWKDPKKWWKELATAQGRKDYDWAHLAARYFPTRVDAKCRIDPSLAVAHHCFWKYHPAKAYAWELRLQDEIRPDFTIDEPGSDESRARFMAEHPAEARGIQEKDLKRREKKNELRSAEPGEDEDKDGPAEDSIDEDADA